VIWSDESSFTLFPTPGRLCVWRTPMEIWFQRWSTEDDLWWFGQQYRSILLVRLLPLMAELLHVITWIFWAIRCIRKSRRYFRTTMQFSRTTVPPFIQLELFSHDLKSKKMNFNVFPGQHNHHIWTSLNHSGRFWWIESGADSDLQQLESNLKKFFKKNGIKFL
jgi:hypothetical protein